MRPAAGAGLEADGAAPGGGSPNWIRRRPVREKGSAAALVPRRQFGRTVSTRAGAEFCVRRAAASVDGGAARDLDGTITRTASANAKRRGKKSIADAIAEARAASWGDVRSEVDQSEGATRAGGALPPELAAGACPSSSASSPAPSPPLSPPASSPAASRVSRVQRSATKRDAAQQSGTEDGSRGALAKNPRKLHYHRTVAAKAAAALAKANAHARSGGVERLIVPALVFHLMHDICDDVGALSGVLDWVRRTHGGGVVTDVEAAALYRERGGVQHDDWSCARARRKAALLVFLLMSPHVLERRHVTGSPSDEEVLVTAGVPQTLLVKMLRSRQREPYCLRTLQRDLAEIEACTDLLLRWRTPVAHAQPWECHGNEHGVVNRYCARVRMVRQQWGRALDVAEAIVKQTALQLASWMVWRPAPARGSPVHTQRGGIIAAPT